MTDRLKELAKKVIMETGVYKHCGLFDIGIVEASIESTLRTAMTEQMERHVELIHICVRQEDAKNVIEAIEKEVI